jgi:hypothetical protein
MDTEYSKIELELINSLPYCRLPEYEVIKLNSLKDLIYTLKVSLVNREHGNVIIENYKEILEIIKGAKPSNSMPEVLSRTEQNILDTLTTPLEILTTQKTPLYTKARFETRNAIDLLSHFLYLYLAQNCKEGLNFELFWTQILIKILNLFNINDNLFSKNLAWRIISDMSIGIRL